MVSYQYDAASNRTRLTWPDAFFVTYAYDAINRLTTVSQSGTTTLASYAYDAASRRTGLTYGNTAAVAYSYTANNDLTNLNQTFSGSTANFTYTYNNVHQRASQTVSNAAYHFAPPAVAGSVAYTPNVVNQYTQVAGVTQSYDANGNLTNDGTNAFTYNTENLLLTATIGGNVQTYSYDPLGRRKQKVATGPFAGTTSFLHDGNQEIAEYDGAGALLRRYVYGPGIDEPVATVDAAGTRSYHHQDGLGSVIALSNGTTGAVAASFAHGPYGETPNPTGTAYRYTGRRIDPETGLYYYRARYYSPNLGRFLQTDPIGYQGGINLYAYVGNDPTNMVDPSGQTAERVMNTANAVFMVPTGQTISPEMAGYAASLPGGWMLDTKPTDGISPVYPIENVLVGGAVGRLASGIISSTAARVFSSEVSAVGLAERAAQVHEALDPIAQTMRTTAVLETNAGRVIAGGARDLTPAQRALLGPGEIAAQLPGAHAEVTALNAAAALGLSPYALAVTRVICPQCAAAIAARGGTLTSPTTAIFGPR